MRGAAFFLGGILLLVQTACAQEVPRKAQAQFINAEGKGVGTATLGEAPGGVRIKLSLSNLPPGVHAFHIHEQGRCDPPDFKTAGGHFNPEGKKHGRKNPQGAHAGDLPNLVVGADGKAEVELFAPDVTCGPGKNSLFQPGGTSLVIHEKVDDEVTDPSGNAGGRVACGIITTR